MGWKPGCGKKLHVSKFGERRLIPGCSNEISSVAYGNAFFDSTDGGVPRNTTYLLKEKRRSPSDLESERTRARQGSARRHIGASFKDRQTESRPAATFEFRSVAIARHLSFGQFSSCLEPHHLCDAIQNYFLLWMLIPGPPRRQARVKTLTWSGSIPLSENGVQWLLLSFYLVFVLPGGFSLGVGIMFVYWAGEIRSRFWSHL